VILRKNRDCSLNIINYYKSYGLVKNNCIHREAGRQDKYTGCPTRYRTGHFFNTFTTKEVIATNSDTHTLQTDSYSFLTQRTYFCSNCVAITSLVLNLLKKCWVRWLAGHTVCLYYSIKIGGQATCVFSF